MPLAWMAGTGVDQLAETETGPRWVWKVPEMLLSGGQWRGRMRVRLWAGRRALAIPLVVAVRARRRHHS